MTILTFNNGDFKKLITGIKELHSLQELIREGAKVDEKWTKITSVVVNELITFGYLQKSDLARRTRDNISFHFKDEKDEYVVVLRPDFNFINEGGLNTGIYIGVGKNVGSSVNVILYIAD